MAAVAGPTICRWEWCSASFTSQDELVDHVVKTHIATAASIKRKEIALWTRAEDGISGEESIFGFLGTPDGDTPNPTRTDSVPNTTQDQPQTGPSSPRPSQPPQHTSPLSVPHVRIQSPKTPSRASPARPAASMSPNPGLGVGPSQNQSSRRTPSASPSGFAALTNAASPSYTPQATPLGKSPTTSQMVADVLNAQSKRLNGLNRTGPTRTSASPNGRQPPASPSATVSSQFTGPSPSQGNLALMFMNAKSQGHASPGVASTSSSSVSNMIPSVNPRDLSRPFKISTVQLPIVSIDELNDPQDAPPPVSPRIDYSLLSQETRDRLLSQSAKSPTRSQSLQSPTHSQSMSQSLPSQSQNNFTQTMNATQFTTAGYEPYDALNLSQIDIPGEGTSESQRPLQTQPQYMFGSSQFGSQSQ